MLKSVKGVYFTTFVTHLSDNQDIWDTLQHILD